MALLPTLLAMLIGVGLGLHWGGRVDHVLTWRPAAWELLAGGVVVLVLMDLLAWSGALVTLVVVLATAALLAFAVINVRIGGMVLVVLGLGLDLLVTVLNWGMPVSGSALVSAGIVDEAELASVQLGGGRELADGAVLGVLGDVIPLPWGHVVSIGDLVLLVGICLVTASVCRQYEVGGAHRGGGRRSGRGRRGPNDYRSALDALGRGPAPRRGPGLHPSRLPAQRGNRRRPGRATR